MNTYKHVNSKIKEWRDAGMSQSDIVVGAANLCIGWPYVYAGRGEECTPSNRKSRNNNNYKEIVDKCQVLSNKKNACAGCKYYPDGTVLFFDCRGFTYWLLKQVGIILKGNGATTQYDDNSNWSEKGVISNMPKDKVCCAFRYDDETKRMEHTLLYDGKGNYIHCSGEVKKIPISKYKATHYAVPKGLEGGVTPVPIQTETKAIVYAENGKPVKLRAKPSTSCNTYWEIQCGTEVDVIKPGNEWTNITDGNHTGYMMSKFLKYDSDPSSDLFVVYIPNLTKEQAESIVKEYPGSYIAEEK